VTFGNFKYYIHKSKNLKEGVNKFLDDVFRGMRGLSCSEYYKEAVDYCKRYPAVYEVKIDLILNSDPQSVLLREAKELRKYKNNTDCMNYLPQFKPEWMLKEVYHQRCEKCISYGVVGKIKTQFRFCPNCGHLNK
jgi:hypothetical protein